MSDMIERVARAIAERVDPDQPEWRGWIDEARAAIEAMREPTEAMIAATDDHDNYWCYEGEGSPCGPEACWQAMIDAALSIAPSSTGE